MKKPILRSAAAAYVLWMLVISSACGGGQPNTNTGQNANLPGNSNSNAGGNQNSNPGADSGATSSLCNPSHTIDQRYADVNAELAKEFDLQNGAGDLYDQTHKVNDVEPNLFYKLQIGGTDPNKYLILYLEGVIEANKSKSNKPFKDFAKIVDPFVAKGCVQRVLFYPPGTTLPPTVVAVDDNAAFGWISCDYPNVACATGACLPSCDKTKRSQ